MRAVSRVIVYLAMVAILTPIQSLAIALKWPLAHRLPMMFHRLTCRIFGLVVETIGVPAVDGPTLFVSNHGSYIDIVVLGSVIPGSFVAKREVAGWPLFGFLAKLQRTVFVDRGARQAAGQQRDSLQSRLAAGEGLILFPEGTSNDGNRALPFKSSLFGAAEIDVGNRPVQVQPVTIAYTGLDGMPMLYAQRPHIAWYGDMELAGHMWRLIGRRSIKFLVVFHRPVTIADYGSRKKLAEYCERTIADTLSAANRGRYVFPAPPAVTVQPESSAA